MRISNEAVLDLVMNSSGVPLYMGVGSKNNVEIVGWLTFEHPDPKVTLAEALRQMADYVEAM